MTPDEVRAAIGRARCELADRVDALSPQQWDADSWCAGWRVRDVLGHLVQMAESSKRDVAVMVLRSGGRADRALRLGARRLGDQPVPALAQRLRDAATSSWGASAVGLGDVLVHGADALGGVGQELEATPQEIVPVLDAYARSGRMIFHARPARGRRLVATDVDWTLGKGPEITGRARDLMLLLANRRQVLAALGGPGTSGV